MNIIIEQNAQQLGRVAGTKAAQIIRESIKENGFANIILATGTSQFETINQLIKEDIDWSKVTMFHLDEYIGISIEHKASFRKYLKERFLNEVPPLKNTYLINGESDPLAECEKLGKLITQSPIDVALVGIGENGHLAFNDPPADFETTKAYIIVNLDEQCRQQQVNEGWFEKLEDVPKQAISMSIHQIMLAKNIICSVPDKRKAKAIADCMTGDVNNYCPASILQQHPNCYTYLDKDSASLL